jgi:mono/diheme cytochrome c family protein
MNGESVMKTKLLGVAVTSIFVATVSANAETQIERGKYLVNVMGCDDCHTPGLRGKNESMFLAGADFGFGFTPAGVVVPSNLTPDNETGLGKWTEEQIVIAITTGKRPNGTTLLPPMPWQNIGAHITKDDATAVAAYLKSMLPIVNKNPGPFGPTDTPTVPVIMIQSGPEYLAIMQKQANKK